jgi:hypothetical protein
MSDTTPVAPPVDAPPPAVVAVQAPPKVRGYKLTTALFFALLVVIPVAGYLTKTTFSLPSMWGVIALSMLAFVLALGADLQGTPLGMFISERNVMSLSRFQLAMWTILISSAFVTIGLARVFAPAEDPLGIQIPAQLWQLLGISATSAVGASLILQGKTNKEPADEDKMAAKVAKQTGDVSPQTVKDNRKGIMYANASPKDARITDIFEGDELANTAYLDLSKVQMFFFTLIALIAYAVNLYQFMADNTPENLESFPVLSPGLIAILGISHAAYLGNKGVTHTKVDDDPKTD